jgi:hypothetical protein
MAALWPYGASVPDAGSLCPRLPDLCYSSARMTEAEQRKRVRLTVLGAALASELLTAVGHLR